MEAKITYCYSILLLLLAIVNGHGAWGISMEEEIELESELRIQGIPGLKSITVNPSFSSLLFSDFFSPIYYCVIDYELILIYRPIMEMSLIVWISTDNLL